MNEKRGGRIIMTNVTMQKQSSLSFNNIQISTKLKEGFDQDFSFQQKSYYLKIENQMNELSVQVIKKLTDILNYLMVEVKKEKEHSEDMLIAIDRVKNMAVWYKKKGINKISTMTEEIKSKKIAQVDYKYLMSVIQNQERFAQKLFEKELTLNRIQSIINFIGDFAFYLEMDLELETLPEITKITSIELISKKPESKKFSNFYSYKKDTYKHIA
ncbi:hypothetical protein AB4Z03_16925 [Bacillus sp. YAF12_1]|uniref:hypothetical protein n=1 Tax=Bacillus sp. YAF12_1 TaxID=3237484 RepID=UPI003F91D294